MATSVILEEMLQSDCTQWFWNTYPSQRRMLFHVDNNSYNAVIGAKKKALGVVKGVSDLIFIVENRVIFIEMKTPTGDQSAEQKDFQLKVEARGHEYVIIRTFTQFKSLVYGTQSYR